MIMESVSSFEGLWQKLEEILTRFSSTNIIFNQYRDSNLLVDIPDAPSIRLKNLHGYLANRINDATILIIGEAAGPWGCRFSGIPFTGEKQLLDPSFPISGTRTSKDVLSMELRIAPPFISRSAEMFWEVLAPFHNQFISWDVFPLHSHKPDNPFTVRNPTNKETDQFGEAVRIIVSYMNPKIIISVGKKSFNELTRLGINSTYVRHPSRGGKGKFIEGINSVFSSRAIG